MKKFQYFRQYAGHNGKVCKYIGKCGRRENISIGSREENY